MKQVFSISAKRTPIGVFLLELDETFAATVLANQQILSFDLSKINLYVRI
jgi:hypothetical protein